MTKYGADIVYNQELIDFKCLNMKRVDNKKFNCVDFVDKSNNDSYVLIGLLLGFNIVCDRIYNNYK